MIFSKKRQILTTEADVFSLVTLRTLMLSYKSMEFAKDNPQQACHEVAHSNLKE